MNTMVRLGFQDLYRVLEHVGGGAFGDVYKVSLIMGGKYQALKILKSEHSGVEAVRERFLSEFKLLSEMDHDNIVRVDQSGIMPKYGFTYFTMDWIGGGSLDSVLERDGSFSAPAVKCVLIQLLGALGHMYGRGIVHRDLKPANILFSEERNSYVIADFGLGKHTDSSGKARTAGRQRYGAGTIPYMAPEQFDDAGSVDIRADIYSLGIMGIELLTGALPDFALDLVDPVGAKLDLDIHTLETELGLVDQNGLLTPVLTKAVAPDPDKRWSDPVEMKQALSIGYQA